jgi:TPR repeat protein
MGYAPAQAISAYWHDQTAAAKGDRNGLFVLGEFSLGVRGCDKAIALSKAISLYKDAVELEHVWAQFNYGLHAFGEGDWDRYRWWGGLLHGEIAVHRLVYVMR